MIKPMNHFHGADTSPEGNPNRLYLKWLDQVVGVINSDCTVTFDNEFSNAVTRVYKMESVWTPACFEAFLSERVFSPQRRDVSTLLARIGISEYNVFEIAKRTRAFSLADKLWIAYAPDEKYETAFLSVFKEMYNNKPGRQGDAISSPSGCNQKWYSFRDDNTFGVVKRRLHNFSDDANNEVAVYRLCQLLGVSCCFAEKVGDNTVFSRYEYNTAKEYLVPARQLTGGLALDCDTYEHFVDGLFVGNAEGIKQMLLLDFVTLQEDRHLSNWAFQVGGHATTMYPLYDNGRSLFSDANEQQTNAVLSNPANGATSVGLVGTYYEMAQLIAQDNKISNLINLQLNTKQIRECFNGLHDYPQWKIEANIQWITWALNELKHTC